MYALMAAKSLRLGFVAVTLLLARSPPSKKPKSDSDSVNLLNVKSAPQNFCPLTPPRSNYTYWRKTCQDAGNDDLFCSIKSVESVQPGTALYQRCTAPDKNGYCKYDDIEWIAVNKTCLRKDCGILTEQLNRRVHLPWQVKIFKRPDRQLSESAPWCAGTIISSTHILTAAHCFENARSESEWNNFYMIAGNLHRRRLGKYNAFTVKKVYFPPNDTFSLLDGNTAFSRKYKGDIAIVELRQHVSGPDLGTVVVMPDITPACLWDSQSRRNNTGDIGIMSKYYHINGIGGFWETFEIDVINCSKLYTDQKKLFYSDKLCFTGILSDKSVIDAKYNGGIGYYAWVNGTSSSSRYQLRGIFSSIHPHDYDQVVNSFTDVSKYFDWIKSVTGEEITQLN